MASETEIANMSISHLGIGKEISNLGTERSAEAAACRRFMEICRKATLEDFPWPFARKFATLNLVEEDPNTDWSFSYRYPSDCLRVRRILSASPDETRQDREPYYIGKDTQGKIILCNKEQAEIEYTENVTDTNLYSAAYTLALSFRLAAYIAPRNTQGDPFKLKNDMLSQYMMELSSARRNAVNEQQDFEIPDSEFIRTRD